MLAKLGAVLINADELGHEVIEPDKPAYQEVLAAFGKSILSPNGEIDRKKLGKLVFDDNTALARLNQIMHPRIYEIAEQRIEEYRQAGTRVVALEAALLIEAGWMSLVDQLWVTTAPEATIVKRLKSSGGLSEEQVLARLRTQMPQEEKAKQADAVIDTDCSMDELRARVTELWRRLPVETEP
jgi:dephospho-CoA kinase